MSDSNELKIALRAVEIFAARRPRPPHVTQKQAAEMLGFSEPTVRKLVRAGKLRLNGCGQIPIEQVDQILLANSA